MLNKQKGKARGSPLSIMERLKSSQAKRKSTSYKPINRSSSPQRSMLKRDSGNNKPINGTNALKIKGRHSGNPHRDIKNKKILSKIFIKPGKVNKDGNVKTLGVPIKYLHRLRVEAGMAKLKRTASMANPKIANILSSNTGVKDLKGLKNGFSLLGADIYQDISELVFRWSAKIIPYENEWKRIDEQYNNALSTKTPDQCNNRFKESKLLFNIVNKVYDKVDLPSYDVRVNSRQVDIDMVFEEIILEMFSDKDVAKAFVSDTNNSVQIDQAMDKIRESYGSREFVEFIVREGVSMVMDKAGVRGVFKDTDEGIYMEALKKGTAFSWIEDTPDRDFPFRLSTLPVSSVIFDDHVLSVRGCSRNRQARKGIIILDYDTMDHAISDFPEAEGLLEECAWGLLPFQSVNESFNNWYTDTRRFRRGQVGIYFDADREIYMLMAGCDATLIDYKDGAMYPYRQDKKAINPIYMTHIFGNSDWIYKKGLGHFASQLSNIDSISGNIMLKAFVHDNSNIDILSVKEGGKQSARRELMRAESDSLNGKRGVALSERSSSGEEDIYGVKPMSGSVQWGADKKQFIDKGSEYDIIGAGVNMYEVNDNPYKTAQAVQNESAVALAIGSRIEEVNSEEWKNLIKGVISRIKKVKSSTPIPTDNFDTTLPELRLLMQPDVGILKMILRKLDISVTTEFTENIRSKDVQRARSLQNVLPLMQQYPVAFSKISMELANINGVPLSKDDFAPPPQEPAPQEQPQGPPIQ